MNPLAAAVCGMALGALLSSVPVSGIAQQDSLEIGEYVTERGWGYLQLTRDMGRLMFLIRSSGDNGHGCGLDGEIVDGKAALDSLSDPAKPCIVDFGRTSEGIRVSPEDICRNYCGARASFDGFYLKPVDGCTPTEIAARRDSFKELYNAKAFSKARAMLEPVLMNCVSTLWLYDEAWIRSDLAIAQYRSRDPEACLETLQPLASLAEMSDEEIEGKYPPSDAANHIEIAKAVRTNMRLCKRGSRAPRQR